MKRVLILTAMILIGSLVGAVMEWLKNDDLDLFSASSALLGVPLVFIFSAICYDDPQLNLLTVILLIATCAVMYAVVNEEEVPVIRKTEVVRHIETPEEKRRREIDEMIEEITAEQHAMGNTDYTWDKKTRGLCEVWMKFGKNSIAVYKNGKFLRYIQQ